MVTPRPPFVKYSFIYFLVRNSFFLQKKIRVYEIISQNNFYFSNNGFPYRLPEIISVAKDIELVSSVGSFLSRPFRCSSSFRQNVLHCRDRVAANQMLSVLKVLITLCGRPCEDGQRRTCVGVPLDSSVDVLPPDQVDRAQCQTAPHLQQHGPRVPPVK